MLISSANRYWLRKTTAIITSTVVGTLLSIGQAWATTAATSSPGMRATAPTELKIYKQTVTVAADVRCSLYEKRAKQCTSDVRQAIDDLIAPAMILQYTRVRIGEEQFEPDAGTTVFLQFRPRDVNYTGQQTLDLELLYIK